MQLAPGLTEHLSGLANVLLTDPFPGATIWRAETELLAAARLGPKRLFLVRGFARPPSPPF